MADMKPIGPIKKGALHASMGIPQGEKIGKTRLEAEKASGSPEAKKRANFALNMAYENGGVVQGVKHYAKMPRPGLPQGR